MASLTGSSIASSYTSLLKLNGNTDTLVAGDGTNAIQVVDGDGTGSALYLNTDKLGIGGQPHVNSTLNVKNSSGTAFLYITSANDADSAIVLEENTTAKWIIGNDGNDSDNLKFGTGGGWASETKMTLTSGGSLGVGTAIPDVWNYTNPTLALSGGSTANNYVAFNLGAYSTSSTGILGDINFTQFASDGTTGAERAIIRSLNDGATDSVALKFYTTPTGGNVTERLKISSGGQIGIANTDPASCWSSADDLVVGSTSQASTGITIMTTTTGDGNLHFADQTGSSNQSYIRYDHNSKKMIFATENTQHLFLDESGNIGTGTTSPSDYDAGANNLVIYENGNSGITIASATTGIGAIHFADGTSGADAYQGIVRYSHSDHNLQFGVSGTNYRFKLDNNSRISLSNNDASGAVGTTLFGYHAGNNVADTGINSTFVGHQSGTAVTTADYNTAIGYRSLFDIVDGGYNTALGSFSLGGSHGTTADGSVENVAIGYSSMGGNFDNSATTDQCVAVGAFAMNGALDNADGSVAVGYKSLLGLTSGSGNTAVGHETLKTNAGGNYNTALGFEAGESLTQSENTLIGYNTGKLIVSSSRTTLVGAFAGDAINATNADADGTTGVGFGALSAMTSGSGNTAVGFQSLDATATGDRNSALGYHALTALTDYSDNTAIGYNALYIASSASHNSALGSNAGDVISTGDYNTIIGSGADPSGSNGQNQTVIGYNATGTGDNEIALGNTSITAIKAQVSSITSYSSDERTKKDIKDYDLKGLDFIKDLQLKTYIYKNPADFPDEIRSSKWNEEGVEKPADPTKTQVGLIAQEVEEALKKHGIGNVETYAPTQDSGIKTLTYGNLIFPLIKAVQELSAKVTELENK